MPDFDFEKEFSKKYRAVCGIDEAGRGPLAGPVCAAAVILPADCIIEGLDDSKKLSEKKRNELYYTIKKKAVAYSIAFSNVEEIESLNILNATFLAMQRAVEGLPVIADFALVDGNRIPSGLQIPCKAIVKGDSKSFSIAAASVMAKVERDNLMNQYDQQYPVYMFKKHKGYGTKLHIEAILKHGPCEIHRKSFLNKIYEKR